MKRVHIYLLVCLPLWQACLNEEIPVAPYERGEVESVQVPMGGEYKNQIWYDLSSEKVIRANIKTAWDLAFGCEPTISQVRLNTSKLMRAAPTGTTDFASVTSIQEAALKADHQTGNPDSLAMQISSQPGEVFVIDLGYDENGTELGWRKIQFLSLDETQYTFKYAQLNGQGEATYTISKSPEYNFVYFSFVTEKQVDIAPPKGQFDLCFTQYTEQFYEPAYIPYLVTGVLINSTQVKIAVDSTLSFGEITADMLPGYTFREEWDIVGYDWKVYNFDSGLYEINPKINYILQDGEGFYYKFHFVDFYSTEGEKGFPTFEVQRL